MSETTQLPLAGVRILDCGIITAGAATSAILADFGADVLKIESKVYKDPFRAWFGTASADPSMSSAFDCNNRGKKGVAINLKHPEGRALFLRLVAKSDAVVENFRRGVMARLGLGYVTLCASNPKIVMAALSVEGSRSKATSFGSTIEAMGGLAAITGRPDHAPLVSGRNLNFPDQAASMFAAGAIVAAILKARADGRGALVDIPQREVQAYFVGEVVAAGMKGDPFDPAWRERANTGLFEGCIKTADGWVAVQAKELARLTLVLPEGESMQAANWEDRLSFWSTTKPSNIVISELTALGFWATQVPHSETLLRGYLSKQSSPFRHSASGRIVKGPPFDFKGVPSRIPKDAPQLGEHTAEVLQDLLHMPISEIKELANQGAIDLA